MSAKTWASSAVKDLCARVRLRCEGDCSGPEPAAATITAAHHRQPDGVSSCSTVAATTATPQKGLAG